MVYNYTGKLSAPPPLAMYPMWRDKLDVCPSKRSRQLFGVPQITVNPDIYRFLRSFLDLSCCYTCLPHNLLQSEFVKDDGFLGLTAGLRKSLASCGLVLFPVLYSNVLAQVP